jgi:Protein of unknown function (DUF4238)
MSFPKRQHYVPRMYLRHFKAVDSRVWVYDTKNDTQLPLALENVAVQKHFYTYEGADGTLHPELELALGEVESKSAPIFDNLLSGRPISRDSKAILSGFLATMYLRTPAIRRLAADLRSALIKRNVSERIAKGEQLNVIDGETATTPDHSITLEELNTFDVTYEVPQNAPLIVLGGAKKISQPLFDMNWSLVTPRNGYFVTSDHPVVFASSDVIKDTLDEVGDFNRPEATISFPLSPNKLLVVHWGQTLSHTWLCNKQIVRPDGTCNSHGLGYLNGLRAAHAEQYIYAHLYDERIQRWSRKWVSSAYGHKLSDSIGFDRQRERSVIRRRRAPKM